MFYISSVGASGTIWLTRSLCKHPSVVCFHGTVRLPPSPEDGTFPALEPGAFAEGLGHQYNSCHGSKVFGAMHGYHGVAARAAITDLGGAFGALFRHPILRIHSLWHAYTRSQPATENLGSDLYGPFKGELSAGLDIDYSMARLELGFGAAGFAEICHVVLSKDVEIIRELPRELMFRIEDLTVDRDAYADMFERMVNPYLEARGASMRLKATDEYLDRVFAMGPVNVRTGNKATPDEVFEEWPDFFKFLFVLTLKGFGGQWALDEYAKLGYDLPDVLSTIDYNNLVRGLWPGIVAANR